MSRPAEVEEESASLWRWWKSALWCTPLSALQQSILIAASDPFNEPGKEDLEKISMGVCQLFWTNNSQDVLFPDEMQEALKHWTRNHAISWSIRCPKTVSTFQSNILETPDNRNWASSIEGGSSTNPQMSGLRREKKASNADSSIFCSTFEEASLRWHELAIATVFASSLSWISTFHAFFSWKIGKCQIQFDLQHFLRKSWH